VTAAPRIVWLHDADGRRIGVDPRETDMEILMDMVRQGTGATEAEMADTREPSDGSRAPTRRECELRHTPITDTLRRLDLRLDAHETAHEADRAERRTQARWMISLMVTVLFALAALSGVVLTTGG